jgi:hypothetical protein
MLPLPPCGLCTTGATVESVCFSRPRPASRLQMKVAPLEDIADMLGRKSLKMTRRCALLGPNELHAVASILKETATPAITNENGSEVTTSYVVV